MQFLHFDFLLSSEGVPFAITFPSDKTIATSHTS